MNYPDYFLLQLAIALINGIFQYLSEESDICLALLLAPARALKYKRVPAYISNGFVGKAPVRCWGSKNVRSKFQC